MKFDGHKEKTYTEYWNNFSSKPKKGKIISKYLRKIKKKITSATGYHLNISFRKKSKIIDGSFSSFQNNNFILNSRNLKINEKIINFLKGFEIKFEREKITEYIEEYQRIYFDSPVKYLGSGFSFNEGIFLFCILKIIKPTDVVESGVMRGFSTYIIDKATTDDCLIHCYDISFDKIEFKSKKALYNNCDITKSPPVFKGKIPFALWDDHVSQLDRLKFSLENKIKFNIFDDDLSFLNFHSDGWPPIPTINMIKESNKEILELDKINWISENRKGEMILEQIRKFNYSDIVSYHELFPEIFDVTGYKNHSQTSFLITK